MSDQWYCKRCDKSYEEHGGMCDQIKHLKTKLEAAESALAARQSGMPEAVGQLIAGFKDLLDCCAECGSDARPFEDDDGEEHQPDACDMCKPSFEHIHAVESFYAPASAGQGRSVEDIKTMCPQTVDGQEDER